MGDQRGSFEFEKNWQGILSRVVEAELGDQVWDQVLQGWRNPGRTGAGGNAGKCIAGG